MSPIKNRFAWGSAVLAPVLAACATPYTHSELRGERYYRTPIDTYPVVVSRIDGRSTPLRAPALVEPGRRTLLVQGPPTPTSRLGEQVQIDLDVKPCTRYYLVAVKQTPLSNDFHVRVDHEETIAGCTPPRT